jgi:hypothetical protein
MIFVIPLVAIGLGFLLILLIRQSGPAPPYERVGREEGLDPTELAMTMTEEAFRVFVLDLFAARGYQLIRLHEEGAGVFVMVMENPQPVFGGKLMLKCFRSHEAGFVSSREVARFREEVKGEPGARGTVFSTLPFSLEAREVARDLGLEPVEPVQLRQLVAAGRTGGSSPGDTDPTILPSARPWSPDEDRA